MVIVRLKNLSSSPNLLRGFTVINECWICYQIFFCIYWEYRYYFYVKCHFLIFDFKPILFSSVQSRSHVRLFTTPWTTACQASLSIINSQSLPKLMSIELVMPSNHLILCYPLLLLPSILPSIRVFSNESALRIRCQSIGVSASTSVLSKNTQDWSPLGWTGWISLQSKGLSRVFSNTTVQKHQFFCVQLSL